MSDIAALVSDHFDIWTAATKRKTGAGRGGGRRVSLYGIERLRALILDLAVRGKLVAQEVDEGDAAGLLADLKKGRAAFIAVGSIKKPRELEDGSETRALFDVPPSWLWVRLDKVGAIIGGGTPPSTVGSSFVEGGAGIPWLTPADLGGFTGRYVAHGERDLSEHGLRASSATVMPKGTVLFTSRAPIGYVAIAENPVATNQGFKSVVPYVPDCNLYVAIALKAFAGRINDEAPGTTFKEVSGKAMAALPFPLPPLAEQRRIVAKVDALMALCDALEGQSAAALTAHQTLVQTLLATLVNSAGAADLAANWSRLEEHLDTLFTTEASVDALKQTVLELAVRGQLVRQDENDSPAVDLIASWQAAKQEKLEQGGDRRVKPAEAPTKPPFPLPVHWTIQSFENVFLFIDYRGSTPPKTDDGIPLITAKNIRMGHLDREPREFVSPATYKSWMTRGFPNMGDLFFTTEAPLGNICLNDIDEPFAIAQRAICLQPYGVANTRFLAIAIMSRSMQRVIDEAATGMTARGIKAAKLKTIALPIPPAPEQERIVAKVDELLTLCENLKAQIGDAGQTQMRLADAIVERAAA